MRILANVLAVALYALAGVALFLGVAALCLFSMGYAVYKIPFIVRERRVFNKALREIARAD